GPDHRRAAAGALLALEEAGVAVDRDVALEVEHAAAEDHPLAAEDVAVAVDDRVDAGVVHRLQAGGGEGPLRGPVLGPEGVADRPVVEAEEVVADQPAELLVEVVDAVIADRRGHRVVDASVDEEEGAVLAAELHPLEEPRELAALLEEEPAGGLEGGVDHAEGEVELVALVLELVDLLADPLDLLGDLVGLDEAGDRPREGLVPALVVEERGLD